MSDGLAQWLGEQLDEDERIVRENSDGRGLADGFPDYRTYSDDDTAAADEYIEHFGPARMLREIDAKRRTIAEHALNGWVCSTCDDGEVPPQAYPCTTLRLLALPYADRPGYREAWRP